MHYLMPIAPEKLIGGYEMGLAEGKPWRLFFFFFLDTDSEFGKRLDLSFSSFNPLPSMSLT